MELQNVLQQRRSIRKYKQQPVEKEKIEEMIQAAIYSESWKNSQTPRYHVIQSKEMLEQFKKKRSRYIYICDLFLIHVFSSSFSI